MKQAVKFIYIFKLIQICYVYKSLFLLAFASANDHLQLCH